jgi:hypothetical protein
MDKRGGLTIPDFLAETDLANTILFFNTFSNIANSQLVPQGQPSPLAYI